MEKLKTKHFSKWASKYDLPLEELSRTLDEVINGDFEANLGGDIFKKRGKRAIFIHGFAKNEKSNLTRKELKAFKELAKVLLGLSINELNTAIDNGDLIEIGL